LHAHNGGNYIILDLHLSIVRKFAWFIAVSKSLRISTVIGFHYDDGHKWPFYKPTHHWG
jgi:hypothetical protein